MNVNASPLQQDSLALGPQFQHDCDTCIFLGRSDLGVADGPESVDLYVHNTGRMPTVIARFGSDGPEYSSGSCFAYGRIPSLTEARLRAQARGLWDYNVYEALFHASKGTDSYAEMQRALPFTLEYQAYLAYEQGKESRARGLLTHLVNLEHARALKYRPKSRRTASVMDVESQMAKIVASYRGLDELEPFKLVHELAEPLLTEALALDGPIDWSRLDDDNDD